MLHLERKSTFVLKAIKLFIYFFVFGKAYSSPADSLINKNIKVLPTAYYSPETRLGLGVFVYAYFNTNKASLINRKSNAQSYFSYTLNKQFSVENDYQIWLKNNKIYLTGGLDYTRFPEYYYGISNSSKEEDRVMISFDAIKFQSKNLVQFKKNLYGGIYFHYQHLYNLDTKIKTPMTSLCEPIPGGAGYAVSGIGPILIYDKRDNPLNPANGAYLETSFQYFNRSFGNSYKFTSFILDARKYHTFFKKLIWNGNAFFHLNKGEVPFRMLATIGGARFLRGFYRGRFRENNMIVLQQEFRMPVYKMLGLAIFGGVGSVAKEVKNFKINEFHYNYGVGIRIRINKKENTNLRLDYGITKDSKGIYVVFAEAF